MKTTKRFILTLAAILGMTGAWAQDAEEVAVTKTANNNEWTLTMPSAQMSQPRSTRPISIISAMRVIL